MNTEMWHWRLYLDSRPSSSLSASCHEMTTSLFHILHHDNLSHHKPRSQWGQGLRIEICYQALNQASLPWSCSLRYLGHNHSKVADTRAPWCPQRHHQCLSRYREHSDTGKERLHFCIIQSSLFYWEFEKKRKRCRYPVVHFLSLTWSVGSYNSLGSLWLTMGTRLTFFHG